MTIRKRTRMRTGVVLASLGLTLVGLAGCSGVAAISRSGDIHEVKIEEGLSPEVLRVGIGDEIRWVNHRAWPVRIDFLDDDLRELSCQRGFTNWLGLRRESAVLKGNESASLCFAKSGVVGYNVRMDSPLPGGKQIVKGEVRVGRSAGGTAAVR